MKRFHQQTDGEWIRPLPGYLMACCDCGLVHRVDFRIKDGEVQFRAFRRVKDTAERRKQKRVKLLNKTIKPT